MPPAFVAFLFVYPLAMLGLMVLVPLTPGWPLPARTLLLVPCMVVAMLWLIQTRLRHLL